MSPAGETTSSAAWFRTSDLATIDLHVRLKGTEVDPEVAWEILVNEKASIEVAGSDVYVLGLTARTLHVALHAAQHGARFPKPLEDLSRAIARVPFEEWRVVADLAARLQATDDLAAGLSLVEEGRALCSRLGLQLVTSPERRLKAITPPPLAVGFGRVFREPGMIPKLRLLVRALIPSPDYMRHKVSLAARGRAGLAAAYLLRPLWLLARSPRAILAWRRASRGEDS